MGISIFDADSTLKGVRVNGIHSEIINSYKVGFALE